jgi:hypothetical protein
MCGPQKKQRLFPYTTVTDWFYNRDGECLLRGTSWVSDVDLKVILVFRGLVVLPLRVGMQKKLAQSLVFAMSGRAFM